MVIWKANSKHFLYKIGAEALSRRVEIIVYFFNILFINFQVDFLRNDSGTISEYFKFLQKSFSSFPRTATMRLPYCRTFFHAVHYIRYTAHDLCSGHRSLYADQVSTRVSSQIYYILVSSDVSKLYHICVVCKLVLYVI